MLALRTHPVHGPLPRAQVLSLTGGGLATVALALLALELAGDAAGVVRGTASAIRTVASVGIAPFADPEDRPAVFAARSALSHGCWLVAYPAAGRLGAVAGLEATFAVMAVAAALGTTVAARRLSSDAAARGASCRPTA
jgi:hypothetical protein